MPKLACIQSAAWHPRWSDCGFRVFIYAALISLNVVSGLGMSPLWAADLYVDATGGANGGDCRASPCATIFYAVGASQAEDVIHVAAGTYAESNIVVAHDLTIAGEDALTTVVDANGLGRIFDVGTAHFIVSSLTLTNGEVGIDEGGAIRFVGGELEVFYSRFLDNVAPTGGAVGAPVGGDLTFEGCEFNSNEADEALGGAIACLTCSSVVVRNSELSRNWAKLLGGAIYVDGGQPPMLPENPVAAQSSLIVKSSLIANNSAGESGGGIATRDTEVLVQRTTLAKNTAELYDGGGIIFMNEWAAGELTIDRSTLSYNEALTAGGAVTAVGFAPASLFNSTFSQNSAGCGGGLHMALGLFGAPEVSVVNSTYFGNLGLQGGCPQQVSNGMGVFRIYNSIAHGGTAGQPVCSAAAVAGSHNLIDDASCDTGAASFNLGAVTLLDPALRLNGGPTKTHTLGYTLIPASDLLPPI